MAEISKDIYDRIIDQNGKDSLSSIARKIASGTTVLDLGAGTGALGHYLTHEKECTVDGVEYDEKRALKARPEYRELKQADLENELLADLFPGIEYDVIVCADVLEHLRDPGFVLGQLGSILAENGRILLSLPNVGYIGVVADLLAGEFRYRPEGLLDRTHLHFFTLKSIFDLIGRHCLAPVSVERVSADLYDSEFRTTEVEPFPPRLLNYLSLMPEAATYQFIVETVPSDAPLETGAALSQFAQKAPPLMRLHYLVQLYWRGAKEKYDQNRSSSALALLGKERQAVRLAIPPLAHPAAELRFDPADRPGSITLFGLRLLDADENVLWEWQGEAGILERARELKDILFASGDAAPGSGERRKLLLYSYDPSFALPVPAETLERLTGGGFLEASLSWPESGDYLTLSERIGREEEFFELTRRQLSTELNQAHDKLEKAQERIGWHISRIKWMEDSPSWRITRPLRKLRDAIGKFVRALRRRKYDLTAKPVKSNFSNSDGSRAFIGLTGKGFLPTEGWVWLTAELSYDTPPWISPHIYLGGNFEFIENEGCRLPRPVKGVISAPIFLGNNEIRRLMIDTSASQGEFKAGKVSMQEVAGMEIQLRLTLPVLRDILNVRLSDGWRILKVLGWQGVKDAIWKKNFLGTEGVISYPQWIEEFDTLGDTDRKDIKEHINRFAEQPLISVIMPVYNTPEKYLESAIESVRGQLYGNWELCIADDASTNEKVREILRKYEAEDPRIRVVYRKENGHISHASNSALEIARGEFVALMDHDDELSEHALYYIAVELDQYPDAGIIYSDEDKIDTSGVRYEPHFKPDWNPDLFYSQNYVSHLGVYRASLVRKAGGFRVGYEGSQDYDLCLRCVAKTTPERIRHIPRVLYHWRSVEGSTALATNEKSYPHKAGVKALEDHFRVGETGIKVEAGKFPTTYRVRYPLPENPPLVSIIIPTKNRHELVKQCLDSIREKTEYKNYEIVVVDNQSDSAASLQYFQRLEQDGLARVLRYDHAFNFSAINNFGVANAKGEIVCLMNNDIEVISPEWLGVMVSHALRPEIGAVGAKLLYDNGEIQHAGIVYGVGGVAGHSHKHFPLENPGYFGRPHLNQNVTGVTGACLMIRKSLYREMGGLEEELTVAFNDVDFCLRLTRAGYRNFFAPYALHYHHESLSRGAENTPEKSKRFKGETWFVERRWGKTLLFDRYYNPNLTIEREDFSIAPVPRLYKPWRLSLDRNDSIPDEAGSLQFTIALESPNSDAVYLKDRVPVAGWVITKLHRDRFSSILVYCGGRVVGETRHLYAPGEEGKVPTNGKWGFNTLVTLRGVVENMNIVELTISVRLADGTEHAVGGKVRVTLHPADLAKHDYGKIALAENSEVFRREDIYGTRPSASVADAHCKELVMRYLGKGGAVLDIGCGRGTYGIELIKEGYEWMGVEADKTCIDRLDKNGLPHVEALPGGPLPLGDGAYENGICIEVLEHIDDVDFFLAEVARVVRKRVLFSVPNIETLPMLAPSGVVPWYLMEDTHVNFFSRFSLQKLLQKHFERVEVIDYGILGPKTVEGCDVANNLFAIADKS